MAPGISDLLPRLAGLLDVLLNIIGLLLWFNWRAGGIKLPAPSAVSLASALKPTEVSETHRWFSFSCLVALLLVRPLVYRQIGSAVNWTATLDITAIALPFRSDLLARVYLFSTLSFIVSLSVVYASLLLLSVINTKSSATDHFTRLVSLQLGWLGKLPWMLRLILAPLAAALLWMAMAPLLIDLGILPAPKNNAHARQITAVLALCIIVSWKYVLSLFMALHLLNSHVYLGNSSFWQYVTLTGHRLAPALRLGKIDLSPILLLLAVIAGSHYASVALAQLYRRLPL